MSAAASDNDAPIPMELRQQAEIQAARLPSSLRMVMRPHEWDALIHLFQRRLLAASATTASATTAAPPPAPATPPQIASAPQGASPAQIAEGPTSQAARQKPPSSAGRAATPVARPEGRAPALALPPLTTGVPTLSQLRDATVFRLRDTPSMLIEGADRAWQAAWRRVVEQGVPWQAQELITLLWWPSASAGDGEIALRLRVDGALKIDPAWWVKQYPAKQVAWILWAIGHRLFRHGTRHQQGTASADRWKTASTLWLESWLYHRFATTTERPWRRPGATVELKELTASIRCGQVSAESLAEDPRFDTAEWYQHDLLEWDAPSVPIDYGAHLDRIRRWVPFSWWEALMPLLTDLSRETQALLLDDLALQHRPEVIATLLRPEGLWGQSTRFWPANAFSIWWREAGPHLQDALHAARASRF